MNSVVPEIDRKRGRGRRGMALLSISAAAGIVFSALTPMSPVAADTAPPSGAEVAAPETASTDLLPAPQLGDGLSDGANDTKGSGVVWDQVVIGDTVYVGGDFQFARPAGAAPGANVVERKNFLAYNLKTGALLDFAPAFNAQVRSLAASPDGKRLYVAGSFTTAAGSTRYRLAAFDVASGALVENFAPTVNSRINAVVATNTQVFVGGIFSSVQKAPRARAAALSAADGAVLPWAPRVGDGDVLALAVSPDEKSLVVGGNFTAMNGKASLGMAKVTSSAGTSEAWAATSVIKNGGPNTAIYSLAANADGVYGTGYWHGFQSAGNFEGTFRANWAGGAIDWMADCHGDTYSVAVAGDVVYSVSHAHYCGGIGGFPEGTKSATSDKWHRALAYANKRTGTIKPNTVGGYHDFTGQPATSLLDWYPDLPVGAFTGLSQAAWDVTAAGDYVLLGGEFPSVNGVKQHGLARFATKAVAPNKDKPQLEGAQMKPTVTSFGGTYVKLAWPANYDRDNASLTYQVIRDGRADAPVFQTTVASRFWQRPTIRATDGYLKPGSTHTYQIRAVDPFGNARWGETVSYTAPASGGADGFISSYDRIVLQDQPSAYWPMSEDTTTAGDYVGSNHMSQIPARSPGVERDMSATARAAQFSGKNTQATSSIGGTAPNVYSAELWFRTTTKVGGAIMNFTAARSATGAAERSLVMNNAGQLVYGVTPKAGEVQSVRSSAAYNDDKWHHVVTTLGGNGLQLFVDGQLVASRVTPTVGYPYSGYWQIGGHDYAQVWAGSPTSSNFFAGSIDDVAIYDRVVSAGLVTRHRAAVVPSTPNAAPSAAFTATPAGLGVAVDGSASKDTDGAVTTFAWNFGDGATGSGATSQHTYAKAGTYTVSLTVTDDKGSTGSTSRQVTVATEPQPQPDVVARDGFGRSVASGWGSAEVGGAWTRTGYSGGTSVAPGAGVIVSGPGQTRGLSLGSVSSASSDSRVSFLIDRSPAAASQYVTVFGRQVGADSYSARVIVQTNGLLQLQLGQNGTNLKVVNVPAAAYTPGQPVNVRLQVAGTGTTTLKAKVWTTGSEPADWILTATDTTASLQTSGSVGLGFYLGGKGAETRVAFSGYSVDTVR